MTERRERKRVYKKAKKMIGKKVCVTCRNGICHYGVIKQVTPQGLYMERHGGHHVAGEAGLDALHADNNGEVQGEPVFFGLFFLPFLAVTALAAFAGAAAGRGYGYGYGGYGYRRYW